MAVKPNNKFLQKSLLRRIDRRKTVDPARLFDEANEAEGSATYLKHRYEQMRAKACKRIIQQIAKHYSCSISEATEMLSRITRFKGERKELFLKLVSGEPIEMPSSADNSSANDDNNGNDNN